MVEIDQDDLCPQRTQEEQRQRYDEHLVGRRIYILWGGQKDGYWATVVCENSRQLCVQHEANSKDHAAGDLELIDRTMRDHTFWDIGAVCPKWEKT